VSASISLLSELGTRLSFVSSELFILEVGTGNSEEGLVVGRNRLLSLLLMVIRHIAFVVRFNTAHQVIGDDC
jgi:hypothetical protein